MITNSRIKNIELKKTAPKKKRNKIWLRIIVRLFLLFIVLILILRFVYPLWLQSKLPADAPRIAFSLDNSIVGMIGITDITYQRHISHAGGRLIKVRPDAVGDTDITFEKVKAFLIENNFDALLLTGGGDIDPDIYGGEKGNTLLVHRLRDEFEIVLFNAARELGLPILGICRGNQMINVALGGTIKNLRNDKDLAKAHLKLRGHLVTFKQDSKLIDIFGVDKLNDAISTHGQAIEKLGSDVKIAATGPKDIIEAIEVGNANSNEWIIGLQFHPELTLDNVIQQRIFYEFVKQARKSHEQHLSESDIILD